MRWAGYKNVCFSRQLPQTALIQTVQMLLAVCLVSSDCYLVPFTLLDPR